MTEHSKHQETHHEKHAEHKEHSKHGHHEEHGGHEHHKEHHETHKHENAKEHAKSHHRPAPSKKVNWPAVIIAGIAVVIIAFLLLRHPSTPKEPVPADEAGQYGSTDVHFYVMSKCPFGTQVEDAIAPVLKEFKDNVNFKVDYIVQETAPGEFRSLHGPTEVEGDKVQLCVQEKYPKKFVDFLVCQNKNYQDLAGSIDKCAEENGIDATKIKECADGEEGTKLLSDSAKASMAVQAQGSPTMYFNNQPYSGGRDADSFRRAICAGLDNHPNCEGIPACSQDSDCTGEAGKVGVCENPGKKDAKCTYKDDAHVTMVVLNSKDCTNCDTTQIVSVLKGIFLNMDVKNVEASSDNGKKLIAKYGLEKAPSFIFSKGLVDTYAWKQNARLQMAFRKVGDDYVMIDEASGATFILDPKKREEMQKKIGVTLGDNRPQIDFYVMSFCPFGNIAEEGIEPVYRLLKDKADFNPHYVIYSNYGTGYPDYCYDKENKYCSMHGIQELHQDIREYCVHKYMGISKAFDFMLAINKQCTYKNADTCWKGVAENLGIDTAKVEKCFNEEALDFLKEEQELDSILGVQGSPTVFIDGQPYSGGRTPADYGKALCEAFDNPPAECDASSLAGLSGAKAANVPAGACG